MAHIPESVLSGRRVPWKQGTYKGKIKGVQEIWSEDTANPSLTFLVQMTEMRELNDGVFGEVLAASYSFRFPVILDGKSLADITDFSDPTLPFRLVRAGGLVGSLALALDAAKVADDGGVELDTQGFLDDLRNGAYIGREVLVEIQNRTYEVKTRTGEKVQRVDDSPLRFAAAGS